MATISELRNERLRKLNEIKKLGIDPYPSKSARTNVLADINQKFDLLNNKTVTVAGRIMNIRKFGKIAFITLFLLTNR